MPANRPTMVYMDSAKGRRPIIGFTSLRQNCARKKSAFDRPATVSNRWPFFAPRRTPVSLFHILWSFHCCFVVPCSAARRKVAWFAFDPLCLLETCFPFHYHYHDNNTIRLFLTNERRRKKANIDYRETHDKTGEVHAIQKFSLRGWWGVCWQPGRVCTGVQGWEGKRTRMFMWML